MRRSAAPSSARRPNALRAARAPVVLRRIAAPAVARPAAPTLPTRRFTSTGAASARRVDLQEVERLVKEGRTAQALDLFKGDDSKDPAVLRAKAKAQKAGKLVGSALETYEELTLVEPRAVDVVRLPHSGYLSSKYTALPSLARRRVETAR